MERKILINNINYQKNPELLRFFIVQYLTKYEFLLEINEKNTLYYIWFLFKKQIRMITPENLEKISYNIDKYTLNLMHFYKPESNEDLTDLITDVVDSSKSNLFSEKIRFKNKKNLRKLIKRYETEINK